MNICYFILDGMLMTTDAGSYKMATFSDEHMNRLFEKFVLEYYRVHHKELSASSEQIAWNITDLETAVIDFLPTMKTDITLHKDCYTLIIDTKYYSHMMQQQFDKNTIHSNNLYQIFTYVKNLDQGESGSVAGMLLYARVQGETLPELDARFGKNRFLVRTLDLNQEFDSICSQLDSFISYLPNSDN